MQISYKRLNFFFANLKFSITRKQSFFFTPFHDDLIPLLRIFIKFGYIQIYTISKNSKFLKVYPRYNQRFSSFKINSPRPVKFLSVRKIIKLREMGYNFVLYNPFLDKQNKFFSSLSFSFEPLPGILLISW